MLGFQLNELVDGALAFCEESGVFDISDEGCCAVAFELTLNDSGVFVIPEDEGCVVGLQLIEFETAKVTDMVTGAVELVSLSDELASLYPNGSREPENKE